MLLPVALVEVLLVHAAVLIEVELPELRVVAVSLEEMVSDRVDEVVERLVGACIFQSRDKLFDERHQCFQLARLQNLDVQGGDQQVFEVV